MSQDEMYCSECASESRISGAFFSVIPSSATVPDAAAPHVDELCAELDAANARAEKLLEYLTPLQLKHWIARGEK